METLAHALQRKSGEDLMKELIESHTAMFEAKLVEVLDRHSLKLGEDGVEVLTKVLQTQDQDISLVYEVRKNNVMVETFGFTLDLTAPM